MQFKHIFTKDKFLPVVVLTLFELQNMLITVLKIVISFKNTFKKALFQHILKVLCGLYCNLRYDNGFLVLRLQN